MANIRKQEVHTPARVVQVSEAEGGRGPSIEIQCIQAGMSLNRVLYPPAVLEEAAPKYEGARCFLDHSWETSVTKLAGSLDKANWSPSKQGVQATLYPVVELEAGQTLLNLAKAELRLRSEGVLSEDEALFGFSHVVWAQGDFKTDEEGEFYEITEITEVESVDAVTFPAANGYMKSMSEARREAVLQLLARDPQLEAVVRQTRETRDKPQRRVRMTKKAKETKVNVNVDAVLGRMSVEGVSREDMRGVAQEAANEAALVYEEHYEAVLEGVRGELQTERERVSVLEGELAQGARREAVENLFDELAVPETRREGFRARFHKEGAEYSLDQARAVLEAVMESIGTQAATGAVGGAVPDLTPREQTTVSGKQAAYETGRELGEEHLSPAQRRKRQAARAN